MRIILDENLPLGLRCLLAPREVATVQQAGHSGMNNGEFLAALEGAFDILITADKNLRFQQKLRARKLAVIELPTNRWPLLQKLQAEIVAAVDSCQPSTYIVVKGEGRS